MSLKSYIYKNKKHPSENSLSLSRFTSSCLLLKPQTFYNKIFKNSDIVVFMTPPSPISNYIVFLMTPPPLKRSDVFYGRPPRRHFFYKKLEQKIAKNITDLTTRLRYFSYH